MDNLSIEKTELIDALMKLAREVYALDEGEYPREINWALDSAIEAYQKVYRRPPYWCV